MAYYLEWHLLRRLVPLLFEEQDREGEAVRRPAPEHTFPLHARLTPVQQKSFDLLGVASARSVASKLTG